MKDEKKVKPTEEEKNKEQGIEMTEERLAQVVGGLVSDKYLDISKRP